VVGLNLLLATLKMHNTFANAYALVARCRKINHESTGTKQKNTAFKRLKFISYFKVFLKIQFAIGIHMLTATRCIKKQKIMMLPVG